MSAEPISELLRTLLVFAKTHDGEFTMGSVNAALADLYHPEMKLVDIFTVLNKALLELQAEPRFQYGNKDELFFDILMAPVKGYSGLVRFPHSLKLADTFSVEQFYGAMLNHIMMTLKLTNMGWCREQLFPESAPSN